MRTSTKMKRKLRKEFPDARFKVRKEKVTYSRAFNIYTDLIEEPDHERFRELDEKLSKGGLKGKELEEYEEIESKIKENREIRRKIKDLLSEWEHVDRCEKSGEILSGGNTFIDVKRWEKTKYLS